MKIFDPEADGPTYQRLEIKPGRKRSPKKPHGNAAMRCRGGCGKKATWPRDGSTPLFCSRLCGYQYAVKLLGKAD